MRRPSILGMLLPLFFLSAWTHFPAAERAPISLAAVSQRPEAIRSFNSYIAKTDAKNTSTLRSGNFLWIDDLEKSASDAAHAKLKRGDVLMQRITPSGEFADIPGGMIHDWEGLVFIPGARLNEVIAFLQDYDHQSTYFAPDVEKSKILDRSGNHYRVFLRFRRKKIVTVVLNTEHDVSYYSDSATRAHSRSSATHIAEVENAGKPSEKEKLPGQDNGFMWRMETWWRMEEKDGGVYLQNQVVSLSRNIPTGLGWVVEPFVTSIPKESLEFTLGAVRRSLLAKGKSAP
jgi:hypothetical protein